MINIRAGFVGVAVMLAAVVAASADNDGIHIKSSQTRLDLIK